MVVGQVSLGTNDDEVPFLPAKLGCSLEGSHFLVELSQVLLPLGLNGVLWAAVVAVGCGGQRCSVDCFRMRRIAVQRMRNGCWSAAEAHRVVKSA